MQGHMNVKSRLDYSLLKTNNRTLITLLTTMTNNVSEKSDHANN
jgi:hypothetical protein